MRRVDFDRYPELEPVYLKLIALTEKLLIEEDGTRPIRLLFWDTMTPNAFWVPTEDGGDRVLAISLGLLKLADTDDQLAYILGTRTRTRPFGLSTTYRGAIRTPRRSAMPCSNG